MPYSIENKIFGIGKETSRGVAVDPTKYIAVSADSELEYKQNLIEDDLIRGNFRKYKPQRGIRECTGKISLDVQSNNIGEFLRSLLGNVVSAQQGGTSAYLHTFTRHATSIQMPSYTIHIDRGLSKKKYNLCVVKSMTLKGSADSKVSADIDILFQSETESTATFNPSWSDPMPFMFYETLIKISGVDNLTDIKDWSLTIDNQSVPKRIFNGSPDPQDILTHQKVLLSGTMTLYFENEDERNKFLNGSSSSLQIILTGSQIEGAYYNKLQITLPAIHYTAFPFGNVDNLLGASVAFNCHFVSGSSYDIQIQLTNTETSY